MDKKIIIAMAVLSGFAGGIIGSLLIPRGLPDEIKCRTIAAENIDAGKITWKELLSRNEKGEILCIMKNGDIMLHRSLVAGNVRTKTMVAGQRVISKYVAVAANPGEADWRNCRVEAELIANEQVGGVLIVRSKNGARTLGKDKVTAGNAICLTHDKKGKPAISSQDLALHKINYIYYPSLAKLARVIKESEGKKQKPAPRTTRRNKTRRR